MANYVIQVHPQQKGSYKKDCASFKVRRTGSPSNVVHLVYRVIIKER